LFRLPFGARSIDRKSFLKSLARFAERTAQLRSSGYGLPPVSVGVPIAAGGGVTGISGPAGSGVSARMRRAIAIAARCSSNVVENWCPSVEGFATK